MAEQAQGNAVDIDLSALTQQICLDLLEQELLPCPDGDAVALGLDSLLSASIPLQGGFEGALALDLSLPLADIIASKMMLAQPGQLMHEEICDGIGEVANVIAGGVKRQLSSETELLPPNVVQDIDYTLTYPDCTPIVHATFSAFGEIMQVTLLERG